MIWVVSYKSNNTFSIRSVITFLSIYSELKKALHKNLEHVSATVSERALAEHAEGSGSVPSS